MSQRIVIVGSGFAGLYAALAAARLRDCHGVADEALDIVVVSPEPVLTVRPRLYERLPGDMKADLSALFDETGIGFLAGEVTRIDAAAQAIMVHTESGEERLGYDRLVLAAGSRAAHPPIPGLAEHAFSNDQRDTADRLWRHVQSLAGRPASEARDTVIIAGGGFTGIETAAEFPHWLREALGAEARPRVIIVERADTIGPDLGPGPRPVIEEALDMLGIERRLGHAVAAIDADGVVLDNGERIYSATVVWTGGLRATPLNADIAAPKDALGRLIVDSGLRVPGVAAIFAAGDTANAATDEAGNRTLMSCQHAMPLGRIAGHNAAAELLGLPTMIYEQPVYGTCLDLGPWGAVVTQGWERQVVLAGAEAKALKTQINSVWIYPPAAERTAAFAAAEPGTYATV
ncbi:NAD(P)/FAD-dependent oxidoreductase [Sphingomonas quercus]|uniref:FAD-dependent oxidoreductase n=1 Tax=Sphingomonas quercus TaxID=2842451 RepID=A0ABS6BIG6_9SPHN|nr:FAD-dependent oxidoreductase [Sphingomonas quercus]MBU3078105.1 FAD-dependent oxidoreductase [Sphingomonas quercus]